MQARSSEGDLGGLVDGALLAVVEPVEVGLAEAEQAGEQHRGEGFARRVETRGRGVQCAAGSGQLVLDIGELEPGYVDAYYGPAEWQAAARAETETPAQLIERVRNGQSGYFAPDDEAFVNLSLALLDDDRAVYRNLAAEARSLQRTRGWSDAAIEFEALWA